MKKRESDGEDEEEEEEQDDEPQNISNFKHLFKNEGKRQITKKIDKFMEQINILNGRAVIKIKQQKHKEAVKDLQQAEQMLEFAASCGRIIDRNLIIVILYNQACAFQWYLNEFKLSQWVLDKCSKYLDGVIYNLEIAIKEDETDMDNLASIQEKESQLVRRYSFLARSYLQYCAILSQLGKHKSALINAKKAGGIMRSMFKTANLFCIDYVEKNDSQGSATTSQSNLSAKYKQDQNKKQIFYMKDDVGFAKKVIENSRDILKDMAAQQDLDQLAINEKSMLKEAKKQLYFWRNNPENNEKHIRQELKIQAKDEDYRSILGVQNVQDWIENFNIGSIMHMSAQTHQEFTQYGEMIYEISKRQLLEKIIYLSISYFTIATELRFVEIDKAKQLGLSDKDITTEEFKQSEIYHLKAIEIACKYISCSSPYINHLITSYHKHYNSNLDTIQEESICSVVSEVNYKEQKLQKFKQVQLQTQKDNKALLDKLNDQSPVNRLMQNFTNQASPLKSNRNVSDNVRPNTNIIEQMIQSKRKNLPSEQSPSFVRNTQKDKQSFVHNERSPERDLSQILRKQTLNDLFTNTMAIQLQPYKTANLALQNLVKQPTPIRTFIFDDRMLDQKSFSPVSSRTNNNRSPDRSNITDRQKPKAPLNKTPQARLRTNTVQQAYLPLKLETIQQLLKKAKSKRL